MTGHTLQAVGHQVVFQAAAAKHFLFQREKRENNKRRGGGKKSNKHKLACAKRQQMGECKAKVKYLNLITL